MFFQEPLSQKTCSHGFFPSHFAEAPPRNWLTLCLSWIRWKSCCWNATKLGPWGRRRDLGSVWFFLTTSVWKRWWKITQNGQETSKNKCQGLVEICWDENHIRKSDIIFFPAPISSSECGELSSPAKVSRFPSKRSTWRQVISISLWFPSPSDWLVSFSAPCPCQSE